MIKFFKKNIYVFLLILIAILFIGYIYLDNTFQAHDLSFHLANIKNIMDNKLKLSLVMPNIGNNLGYGLYIFYPFLPHYTYALLASILEIFSLKIIDSVLITNILVSVVSSIFMYILSYRVTENKRAAFVSSLIYLLFPYRLGCITVRMAIAENFSSIFLPIILLSIYYLFNDKKEKFYLLFILGYTGLIFSHYLIAMYFSIFLVLILLLNVSKLLKNKRLGILLFGILIVSLLVLPNIIIFTEHFGLNYLVYMDNYVTNLDLVKSNILSARSYLFPSDNYDWTIPYYIYITVILFIFYSGYLAIKKNRYNDMVLIMLIGICIFMISSSKFWELLPNLFYNIQFPWRLLLILSVFISLLAPKFLIDNNNKYVFIVTVILCVVPSMFLINKLSNRVYHMDYSTIDISSGTGNINEYYPDAYYYFEDYYKNKNTIDIISGEGNINIVDSDFYNYTFSISDSKDLVIELPRIYYKGYKLTSDLGSVELLESEYGFIAANLTDGVYKLEYTGTFMYKLFRIFRFITVIIIGIILIYRRIYAKYKG